MPFVNRFLLNDNGAITFTGNTLGLSRSDTVAVPGTIDSIGGFITTDTTQQYGQYPPGTTSVFLSNSSAAILVLPPGSSVLYAELIWGGTYIDNGVDLSLFIDNPVTFVTSAGTFQVPIDPATSFNVLLSTTAGFPPTFAYVRSSDVTSIVQQAGAGTYSTSGVTGTIIIPDPNSNHAGWTLAVVYNNPALPLRNLSLRVGAVVIQSTSGPVSTVVNGFATPVTGGLDARVLISAQEGDANNTGDQALFGLNATSLTALSGPNNLVNNFFASQINGDDGTLNTTGTFGNRNQINGNPGTNIIGGRQGWDITNVDGSSTLVNNQTSAVFQVLTSGDGYLVDANALQIQINQPLIQVVKSANVQDAVLGDVITYTIQITNSGVVDATNGMFVDTIAASSVLVPGSVFVNNVQNPTADPNLGIALGTIVPNQTITIRFQVTVVSFPTPNVIKDQAEVMYTYVPSAGSQPISTFVPSNIVNTPVFNPIIGIVKDATPLNVVAGQSITYSFAVTNSGNIAANTTLNDLLPAGSSFVPGSVTINGISQPGLNPANGIPIGNVQPDATVTASFQAFASAVPSGGVLTNTATANFTYQPPDGRIIPGSSLSNPVTVTVSSPNVTATKAASLADAIVGETLSYTVNVTNNSAVAITNVIVTDPIPAGSSFVTGSVTVGGVSQPLANPSTGIAVGTIAPLASVQIAYQTTVTAIPPDSTLDNQAAVSFQVGSVPGTSFTNTVSIPIFQAVIEAVKNSDVNTIVVGNTINYSISVINLGNIAVNAVVTDILSPYTTFVPGSVRVSGVVLPGADPAVGIPTGTIQPNNVVQVSFTVLMTSVPPTLQFSNQATVSFTYQLPDNRTFTGTAPSNIIMIHDPTSPLTISKAVNMTNAFMGSVLTYTITLVNTGDIPLTDAVIIDSISPGTQLVPNSVTVNGVTLPNANPDTGVPIGTISAGEVIVFTFQQIVVDADDFLTIDDTATAAYSIVGQPQTIVSNPVQVTLIIPNVTASKSASSQLVTVGDTIVYRIVVTNSGNIHIAAVVFDNIPNGTVFIGNSVIVNHLPFPGTDPVSGIFIGTVEFGTSTVVTFQVLVQSVPPSQQLVNQSTIDYNFVLSTGESIPNTTLTNVVVIPVVPIPSLVKSANKKIVIDGQSLTFTLVLTNPSSLVPIVSARLKDTLPAGLSFIPQSVKINGINQPHANIEQGIELGVIEPNRSVTVTFDAEAAIETLHAVVVNQAQVSFLYQLASGASLAGTASSNQVEVTIESEEE